MHLFHCLLTLTFFFRSAKAKQLMAMGPGLVDSFGMFAYSMADPHDSSQVRTALPYPLMPMQ
jgi:hypothetical protein